MAQEELEDYDSFPSPVVTKTPLWNFAEQTDSGSQAQTKTKATTATAQAQLVTSTPVKPPAPQVKAPAQTQAQPQAPAHAQMRPPSPAQLHRPGPAYFPQPQGAPPRAAKRMPAESLNEDRLLDFPESESSLIASKLGQSSSIGWRTFVS